MISVPIDRIVPLTDARDNFSRLIHDIETLSDGLYVLTKGGKPAIALINIKYLEEIMGNKELPATSEKQLATSHKIEEPAPKKPEARSQMPAAPFIPKPSFEVPRITTAPIGPSAEITSTPLGVNAPKVAPPYSNYDVKPTVNPTWTGEELKINQPTISSLAPSQSPSSFTTVPKPEASSQLPVAPPAGGLPPIAQFDKPSLPPPPPTPSKPTINPWPIIPPRRAEISSNQDSPIIPPRQVPPVEKGYESSTTVPPRPVNTALPLAPSSLAPSPSSYTTVPKPEASSPSTGLGVNPLPEASYPKMVAPPPPPPPSSLPRIPSSFQTVPVPISGSKQGLETSNSGLDEKPVPANNQSPAPSPQAPAMPLPPPPITTAPAPFANTSPGAPVVTPKPADSIAFDQPPTTIPEPGEDLPEEPLASSNTANSQNSSAPVPKPEASSQMPGASLPPSVKDLEI